MHLSWSDRFLSQSTLSFLLNQRFTFFFTLQYALLRHLCNTSSCTTCWPSRLCSCSTYKPPPPTNPFRSVIIQDPPVKDHAAQPLPSYRSWEQGRKLYSAGAKAVQRPSGGRLPFSDMEIDGPDVPFEVPFNQFGKVREMKERKKKILEEMEASKNKSSKTFNLNNGQVSQK